METEGYTIAKHRHLLRFPEEPWKRGGPEPVAPAKLSAFNKDLLKAEKWAGYVAPWYCFAYTRPWFHPQHCKKTKQNKKP
jgi:hypothetical protein